VSLSLRKDICSVASDKTASNNRISVTNISRWKRYDPVLKYCVTICLYGQNKAVKTFNISNYPRRKLNSWPPGCKVGQQTLHLLWNPELHNRIHKSRPLILILNHLNPIHAVTFYFFTNDFSVTVTLRTGVQDCLLPSGFPIKMLYLFVISPMCTTCLAYIILLDLITVILSIGGHNVWCTSLFYFLNPPVNFFICFQISSSESYSEFFS
jgi:hypothetical protein